MKRYALFVFLIMSNYAFSNDSNKNKVAIEPPEEKQFTPQLKGITFLDESVKPEHTDIDIFRRKIEIIQRWSQPVKSMDKRLKNMYNERVKSAAELLRKIHKKISSHQNKEVAGLALNVNATELVDIYTCSTLFRTDASRKQANVKDIPKPRYLNYKWLENDPEKVMGDWEVKPFYGKSDDERDEYGLSFAPVLKYTELDLLERIFEKK